MVVSVMMITITCTLLWAASRIFTTAELVMPCNDVRLSNVDALPCSGFVTHTGYCYVEDAVDQCLLHEYLHARVLYETSPYATLAVPGTTRTKWSRDVTISHFSSGTKIATRLRDSEAICIAISSVPVQHGEL